MPRISTFDDWIDYFRQWQKEIGLDISKFGDYQWEAKFGECAGEIEFGDFRGRPKWENVLQIPDQRIRDSLQHLIVYQGDTEFASVEQQRRLIETAPSDYDLGSLIKVMREEMRHGWQMSYLLVTYFGRSGKIEAQKLLERRADRNTRLLGSFNEPVNHWLDFFCFTELVDRDGKYQLKMLSHSSFAPLARSMGPMLKEEFYHLLTGHTGLTRVVRAGRIPLSILQKYINRWYSTALDLFGVDNSSSAYWFYVWGLKGRYNEDTAAVPADKERLNELARQLYTQEVTELIDSLNKFVPEDQPRLRLPDMRFNRKIGEYAGKTYSIDGQLLSPDQYQAHLAEVLPGPADEQELLRIFKEKDWILPVS